MNIRTILPAAIAATALLVPSFVLADTETVDGIEWTYSIIDGKAVIGTGEWADNAIPRDTSGNVAIPSSLGGCSVTAIDECAFYNCYSITSVTIPHGVVSIGRYAFSQCSCLTSVTIPETLTSIGGRVFEYCPIQTISIPAGVSSIGEAAFYRCTSLTEITVSPDNQFYKSIGGVLFDAAQKTLLAYPAGKGGASYEIPAGVETIGSEAFHNSNLASILIPDGVTVISAGAFSSCMKLESITIPASVSIIGDGAFTYAIGIQDISVDSDNRRFRVEGGALVEADTLKFFPLGNGVVSYTIPDGITKIAARAFYGHQTLESVVIPESVTQLGYVAFYLCPNLRNVEIRGRITVCDWDAFASNYELTNVVISSGTSLLGGGMFEYCRKLETITIPDSVASVGNSIFYGCSGLASVSIPYALQGDISDWSLPTGCEIVVRDKIPLAIATDATLPVALTEISYWQPLAAVGGLPPYTWEIVNMGGWPGWLSSDYISHWKDWGYAAPYLSGTPYEGFIGTHAFALRVTDAEGASAEKAFTLEVKKNPNRRPVIDSTTPSAYNLTLATGETATLSVSAYDPDDDALSYRWYGYWYDDDYQYTGHHDLGVFGSGDTFYFSRPVGGEGVFYIGCEVSDGSFSSWVNWRISVRNIPVVETAELPSATEGVAYSTTLAAHGGTAPYTWSLAPSGYVEQSQPSMFAVVGDAQGWNDDDGCWTLDLPFAFPFYGGTYTKCHVSDNGTIAFDGNFSQWSVSESEFLAHSLIAAMWHDLGGSDMDVYVESASDYVTIGWKTSYYWNEGKVNFSATLYPDGRIVLSYGEGNANGGFIGLSAGDGETQVVSAKSQSGSMANAGDIVFVPAVPPAGMTLSEAGILSGTPDEPGEFALTVVVTDAAGETGTMPYILSVAENGALRPGFSSVKPEPGYVNMGAAAEQTFTVATTHPASGEVAVEWFLDGESVGTGGAYAYGRGDDALHTLRVVARAADLPKTAVREWKVGTMTISDPAPTTVSCGMSTTLSVKVFSPFTATVIWFDDDTDEELGTGMTLTLRNVTTERHIRAQASNALGTVVSAPATVSVTPKPAVGRIYKMTGPAFIGNRLVLRAKTWGDLSGATFAWKRGGVTVATTERLDIASLDKSDFGAYTFTMTNPHGSATTETFVLEEAKAGVPYGWGAGGHGRTTAPEGLGGVVQVASGMNFNLGLTTNGTVTAWGFNGHGGCDVPDGLGGVSFVAAGGWESFGAGFVVKADGTVAAWGQPHKVHSGGYVSGYDTVGEMPDDLHDVVQVAVGACGAIALKADGSVVTWGKSGYDYDIYNNLDYTVPEDVSDVVAVAAGGTYVMALRADGTVAMWGNDNLSSYVLPEDLDDAVFIDAGASAWGGVAFAIRANGAIAATEFNGNWGSVLLNVPESEAGFASLDIGQSHGIALDAAGRVAVWGYTNTWNYSLGVVPAAVKAGALGVSAGGYHCTAILADTDGDTIADNEERLLGRDPLVWEDSARVEVSGGVTATGVGLPYSSVELYDASGALRADAEADENGDYAIQDLIPGRYFVKVSADLAADIWLDGVAPSMMATAPLDATSSLSGFDFDLEPGQAKAYARVVAHRMDADASWWWHDECETVTLPDNTQFYIDLWPAETTADGRLDLGEVAASHGDLYWETAPHVVTVKVPGGQIPVPCEVDGAELATVEANPHFSEGSGSVRVVTDPTGAEVWIDYADNSLGVTPLTVDNLAAASHAHILLLKKNGYLQPRPVLFGVEVGGTTEISVPLAPDSAEGLSVAVSSAVEGLDIYLDYLPTGEVTPATIGGLDPASHAADLWHSASHSILLRGAGVAPILPRPVDETFADPQTGLMPGGEPVRLNMDPQPLWGHPLYGQTLTENEADLKDWLVDLGLADDNMGSAMLKIFEANLKTRPAANAIYSYWDCYEAGLVPTNPAAAFLAKIEFDANGNLVVKWDPDLNKDGTRHERNYEVEGKEHLTDSWGPTNEWSRFFRVNVTLP